MLVGGSSLITRLNDHKDVLHIEPPSPSSPLISGRTTALDTPTACVTSSSRFRKMAIISPRSSDYERLEGGMGPSRTGGKKFAWKKFAIGAAVIIGLVWFFGPRAPRSLSWGSKEKESGEYWGCHAS